MRELLPFNRPNEDQAERWEPDFFLSSHSLPLTPSFNACSCFSLDHRPSDRQALPSAESHLVSSFPQHSIFHSPGTRGSFAITQPSVTQSVLPSALTFQPPRPRLTPLLQHLAAIRQFVSSTAGQAARTFPLSLPSYRQSP